jgi:hypothetical protein
MYEQEDQTAREREYSWRQMAIRQLRGDERNEQEGMIENPHSIGI